jgi:hypothetical protein
MTTEDGTPGREDEEETHLGPAPEDDKDRGDAAEDLAENEDLVDQEPGSAAPGG